jgi:hypothetical protein
MDKMAELLLALSLKDWLIIVAFCALLVCLLEIQRLKKQIAYNSRKSLAPQLMLELSVKEAAEEMGIYLKNEGFFIAQQIKIDALKIGIDDYGFRNEFILEFEGIEVLRPKERKRLVFKVFDRNHAYLQDATERLLPHLVSPAFKIVVFYSNIEGVRFRAEFSKTQTIFSCDSVRLLEEKLQG